MQALGAQGEKIRAMQAEFAQKIGEMTKEKEDLQKQLEKASISPSATSNTLPLIYWQ